MEMRRLDFKALLYFCTIADTENLSSAAKRLGVSQPYVSKIISQLEEELGCRLYDYQSRKISLNSYGRELLPRARRILELKNNIAADFCFLSSQAAKPILLGVCSSAYCSDLPFQFKESHPGSVVQRSYLEREELSRSLLAGETDFGICSPPLSDETLSLNTKIVYDEGASLVMSITHPLAKKEHLTIFDLQGLELITTPIGSDTRNNIDLLCSSCGVIPNIIFETIDNYLILQMVKEGQGCTIFAETCIKSLPPDPYILKRSIENVHAQIGFSYRTDMPMTEEKSSFIEFVTEYFESLHQ